MLPFRSKQCQICSTLLTSSTSGDWRAPACLKCVPPAAAAGTLRRGRTVLAAPTASTLCVATHLEGNTGVGALVDVFCQQHPNVVAHRRGAFPGQPRRFTEIPSGLLHKSYGAGPLRRCFVEQNAPSVVNDSCSHSVESLRGLCIRTLYINSDSVAISLIQGLPDLEVLTLQDCHQLQRDLGELAQTNPKLRRLCLVRCGPVNTLPEHIQVLWVEHVQIHSDALAGLTQLRELRTFRAFRDLVGLPPARCKARAVSFEVGPAGPEAFARFAMSALVTKYLDSRTTEEVRLVCRVGKDANPSVTIPGPLCVNFTRFTHKAGLDFMAAEPTCRFDPAVPGLSSLVLGPDVVLVTEGAPDTGALSRAPSSLKRLALMGLYSLRGLDLETLVVTNADNIMFPPTYVAWSELVTMRQLQKLILDPDIDLRDNLPCTVLRGSAPAPRVPPALQLLSVVNNPMFEV